MGSDPIRKLIAACGGTRGGGANFPVMQDPRITDFLTSLQLERDASPHTISAYRTDLAELQALHEEQKEIKWGRQYQRKNR